MTLLKDSKMHKHIDKLLKDGKKEEACILIEEVWRKRECTNQEKIADLTRRLEAHEKRLGTKK